MAHKYPSWDPSSRYRTTLTLKPHNTNSESFKEYLIPKTITNSLLTRNLKKGNCKHLKNIQLTNPTFWKPGKIDALLWFRLYTQIIQDGIIKCSEILPTAINTTFGWILLEPTEYSDQKITRWQTLSAYSLTTNSLNEWLWKFGEIE